MNKFHLDQRKQKEKVLLVVIEYKRSDGEWSMADIQNEMAELVVACQGEVVDSVLCRLDKPSASYLIGAGKVEEIAEKCRISKIDAVIFSLDLKGSQQRNLEDIIKVKTIDRTQLILDIFVRRASSNEGRMQVELAQLEYLMPRLVGKGIELSRLGGGIGTSGPGETKLEVDRRRIGERITKLKRALKEVALDRNLKRKKRKDHGLPGISLVGYTNAGKSTILNTLTGASQLTQDALFTTLDSLSRQMVLPNHQKVVLSDTVGFMRELPHHLIEAFKATLEEVQEADLLLHVVDISHPDFRKYIDAVETVLKELNALDKPTITVLNKIDKVADKQWLKEFESKYAHTVSISAQTKENIDKLLAEMVELLSSRMVEINVDVPIDRMDLVSLAHKEGVVYYVKYYTNMITIKALVPAHLSGQFYRSKLSS